MEVHILQGGQSLIKDLKEARDSIMVAIWGTSAPGRGSSQDKGPKRSGWGMPAVE